MVGFSGSFEDAVLDLIVAAADSTHSFDGSRVQRFWGSAVDYGMRHLVKDLAVEAQGGKWR